MIAISKTTPERLSRVPRQCPAHYRPIILAVRDHRCGYALVMQDAKRFTLPLSPSQPAIIVIGDDLHVSKGPNAFHAESLVRTIMHCEAAFVIASGAEVETYTMACVGPTALRKHVVIVETLPAHEQAWVDFISEAKPGICMVISKADPLQRPEPQTWGRA